MSLVNLLKMLYILNLFYRGSCIRYLVLIVQITLLCPSWQLVLLVNYSLFSRQPKSRYRYQCLLEHEFSINLSNLVFFGKNRKTLSPTVLHFHLIFSRLEKQTDHADTSVRIPRKYPSAHLKVEGRGKKLLVGIGFRCKCIRERIYKRVRIIQKQYMISNVKLSSIF